MESLELGESGHSSTMLRTRLAGGRNRQTACKMAMLLKRDDAATRPAKYWKCFRRSGSTRKELSSAIQLFVSISPKRRTSGSAIFCLYLDESRLDMTEMKHEFVILSASVHIHRTDVLVSVADRQTIFINSLTVISI